MAELSSEDGRPKVLKEEHSFSAAREAQLARVANELLAGRMTEFGDEGLDSMLGNFEQLAGLDMNAANESFAPVDSMGLSTATSLYEQPVAAEREPSLTMTSPAVTSTQDPATAAVLQALVTQLKQQQMQQAPQFQPTMQTPLASSSPMVQSTASVQAPLASIGQTHLSPSVFSQLQHQSLGTGLATPLAQSPLSSLLSNSSLMSSPSTAAGISPAVSQDLLYQLLLQQAQPSVPANPAVGGNLLDSLSLDQKLMAAMLAQHVNTIAALNTLKQATVSQLISNSQPATPLHTLSTSVASPLNAHQSALPTRTRMSGSAGIPSPPSASSFSPSPQSPPPLLVASMKSEDSPSSPSKTAQLSPASADGAGSPAGSSGGNSSSPGHNSGNVSDGGEYTSDHRSTGGGKMKKTPRRSSHNAIERRYRFSINDRIKELREKVGGSEKLHKSGVLQRALDQLDLMTKDNSTLRQQNEQLQRTQEKLMSCISAMERRLAAVGMTALETHSHSLTSDASLLHALQSERSPGGSSSSGYSEAMSDITHSPTAQAGHFTGANIIEMSSLQHKAATPSRLGMADSTRVVMCMVMMFCVAVVPGGPLQFNAWSSQGDYNTVHNGGRTLAGLDLDANESPWFWPWTTICLWLAQVAFVLIGLAWVLVRGEPILVPSSAEAIKFNRHHQQAKLDFAKGAFDDAVKQLEMCLVSTGRGLPMSFIDLWVSLAWQLLYTVFIVTRTITIVQWLVQIPRYILGSIDIDGNRKDYVAQKSARQAALIYHKLHCLALTGHVQYSSAARLHIALSSLNLAKCARSTMERAELAEIYATVAMELRHSMPWFFAGRMLSNIMLHRSRSSCHPPPPSLYCLLHPEAVKFLSASAAHELNNLWSQPSAPGQPLAVVSRQLRKHLFKQTLHEIVITNQQDSSPDKKGSCSLSVADVQANLTSLRQLCRLNNLAVNASLAEVARQSDTVSLWWCNVLTVATLWLAGEDGDAAELYTCIMHQPRDLKEAKDNLPAVVLAAFISRRAMLNKAPDKHVLELCDSAGKLLEGSVANNKLHSGHRGMPSTHQLVQLLCCDWLLSTRAAIWQEGNKGSTAANSFQPHVASRSALASFNHDLAVLQRLAHTCSTGIPQVFLYEATARFMAGANPLRTQHLLAQATKMREGSRLIQSA